MEQMRMLPMGSTTIHQDTHINGFPQLCEQDNSIGQIKEYNGVCSEKSMSKTPLQKSLVLSLI